MLETFGRVAAAVRETEQARTSLVHTLDVALPGATPADAKHVDDAPLEALHHAQPGIIFERCYVGAKGPVDLIALPTSGARGHAADAP